jgi:hypothetical protein
VPVFKYDTVFDRQQGDAFDDLLTPGTNTSFSGIYRCEACHHEIVSEKGKPLPSQNHAQHDPKVGKIIWRLVAATIPAG